MCYRGYTLCATAVTHKAYPSSYSSDRVIELIVRMAGGSRDRRKFLNMISLRKAGTISLGCFDFYTTFVLTDFVCNIILDNSCHSSPNYIASFCWYEFVYRVRHVLK
jgi:hypothetical protein